MNRTFVYLVLRPDDDGDRPLCEYCGAITRKRAMFSVPGHGLRTARMLCARDAVEDWCRRAARPGRRPPQIRDAETVPA